MRLIRFRISHSVRLFAVPTWLLMLISSSLWAQVQPDTFLIRDTISTYSLDTYLWVYEDTTKELTAEQVIADTSGNKYPFRPFHEFSHPLQLSSAYWGKISITSNVTLKNWQLVFKGRNFEGGGWARGNGRSEVYTYGNQTLFSVEKTGSDVPKKEKSIQSNWNINRVPFSIEEGEIQHLLIRIEGNSFEFQPDFGLTAEKRQKDRTFYFFGVSFSEYQNFISVVLGMILILLIYHLTLLLYLRESIYGWYSLWLLFIFLTSLMVHPSGFISEYLIGNTPWLRSLLWSTFASSVWIIFWQFGRDFIETKQKFRRIDLSIRILMGMLILNLIGNLIICLGADPGPINIYYYAFLGLSNLAGIVISLILIFKKDKLARYFGVGSLVANLGVILGALWTNGVIRLSFDPFITAIILQIIIYSFGLAYKRQLEEREKRDTEKKTA